MGWCTCCLPHTAAGWLQPWVGCCMDAAAGWQRQGWTLGTDRGLRCWCRHMWALGSVLRWQALLQGMDSLQAAAVIGAGEEKTVVPGVLYRQEWTLAWACARHGCMCCTHLSGLCMHPGAASGAARGTKSMRQ